ncbi:hypothetical protein AMTRI_Chr08g167340 [Amborella trichopoda]
MERRDSWIEMENPCYETPTPFSFLPPHSRFEMSDSWIELEMMKPLKRIRSLESCSQDEEEEARTSHTHGDDSSGASRSSNNEIIRFLSSISEDVTLRIISSLPINSIFRFKCVCKSWNQLLSSPHFARIHSLSPAHPSDVSALACVPNGFFLLHIPKSDLSHKASPLPFAFVHSGGDLRRLHRINLPSGGTLRLVLESHGMVCFSTNQFPDIVYIFNPVTREYAALPVLKSRPEILGFFFDLEGQVFKVLVSFLTSKDECWVFSSATGQWKSVGAKLLASVSGKMNPFLCVRGVCYGVFQCVDEVKMFGFDMEREEWEIFTLPLHVSDNRAKWLMKIVEWEGRPYLVHGFAQRKLGIWVFRKEDAEKWMRVTEICLEKRFGRRPDVNVIMQHRSFFVAEAKNMGVCLSLYSTQGKRRELDWEFFWHPRCHDGPLLGIFPFTPRLFSCNYMGN